MRTFLFISALLFTHFLFAQDVILLQNGNELQAKVMEITQQEVRYKRFDNLDGPIISIPASQVFMIKYPNGTKDLLKAEPVLAKVEVPLQKDTSDLYYYNKGTQDAEQYFSTTGASLGTFAATIVVSPVGGLVTAIATSSSTPKLINFNTMNQKMLDNPNYVRGYQKQAKRKKQHAVWPVFGLGLMVDVILIAVLTIH